MARRLSMATRRELKQAVGERYRVAGRWERRQILDEFTRVTGYHRKHALRVLHRPFGPRPARPRKRIYDEAVRQALALLWEAADRICGKRLKALLPVLIESMERHGHLRLDPVVRSALLDVSAATIDRLLRPMREASGRTRRRRWGLGSAVRQSVPVRTFDDWGEPPPGYCEADLVEHCGGEHEGSFAHSLTLTDIHSGWTECAALVVREQTLVVEGISLIRRQLPFALRGLDTDNDSVFINETLQNYCREHQLEWTRSRAYRKNDQAWVEQKNGAVVRRLAGYGRLSGLNATAALGRLYQSARLYVNFFQPSFKLASKQREGTLVRRRYHPPLTPCQRLLGSRFVDETAKDQLRQRFAALDPVALLKAIRDTQQELAAAADGSGQPPARASEDLSAFLDGLATAWQKIDRPPQGRRKAATKHWWRTRIDPFAYSWPLVEDWLRAKPDITAKVLMQRLCEQFPDVYPTGAQLRTLQRRVQLWRNEQVKRLIFQASDTHLASSEIASLSQNGEATTNIER
ncbi:MAG TPA: transposase family protein [Stellaceae bacterium]|nr:transposase family protein [Stellaceae bacterium]